MPEIEAIGSYLVRKKILDEKYYFFVEKSLFENCKNHGKSSKIQNIQVWWGSASYESTKECYTLALSLPHPRGAPLAQGTDVTPSSLDTYRPSRGRVGIWLDLCATPPGPKIAAVPGNEESRRVFRGLVV